MSQGNIYKYFSIQTPKYLILYYVVQVKYSFIFSSQRIMLAKVYHSSMKFAPEPTRYLMVLGSLVIITDAVNFSLSLSYNLWGQVLLHSLAGYSEWVSIGH